MWQRSGLDATNRPTASEISTLLELKGGRAVTRSPLRLHWQQILVASLVVCAAVMMPRIVMTCVLLLASAGLALAGFVFLVQLPVRFLSGRLHDSRNAGNVDRARLS